MTAAIGAVAASFLMLAVAAGGSADTTTCRTLDALSRANSDAVADALRAYQSCIAETPGAACFFEIQRLEAAQEVNQAAFARYLKACGAAVAARWGDIRVAHRGDAASARRREPLPIGRLVAGAGRRQDDGASIIIEKGWRRWPTKA